MLVKRLRVDIFRVPKFVRITNSMKKMIDGKKIEI